MGHRTTHLRTQIQTLNMIVAVGEACSNGLSFDYLSRIRPDLIGE